MECGKENLQTLENENNVNLQNKKSTVVADESIKKLDNS